MKIFKPHQQESGFTLMELLVVIVIIVILSAIGLSVFSSQKARARDAATNSDVHNLALAAQSYLASGTAKNPTYVDLITGENAKVSPDTIWSLSSSGSEYCITAYNSKGKQFTSSTSAQTYSSIDGGLGRSGATCSTNTTPSTGNNTGSNTGGTTGGDSGVGSDTVGPNGQPITTVKAVTAATAAAGYECTAKDHTLSGSTCTIPTATYSATPTTTQTGYSYSCANGGTLSGSNCITYNSSSYPATYYSSPGYYYCSNGWELRGSTCGIWYANGTPYYTTGAQYASGYSYYGCPSGGSVSGSSCIVSSSSSSAATATPTYSTTYACPNGGNLSGSTCTVPSTTYSAKPATVYTCPDATWTVDAANKVCYKQ